MITNLWPVVALIVFLLGVLALAPFVMMAIQRTPVVPQRPDLSDLTDMVMAELDSARVCVEAENYIAAEIHLKNADSLICQMEKRIKLWKE